jgi:hypothetical protein
MIELPEGQIAQVVIRDLTGKLVAYRLINAARAEISFSRLQAGNYLIEVEDNRGGKSTEIIVKQ